LKKRYGTNLILFSCGVCFLCSFVTRFATIQLGSIAEEEPLATNLVGFATIFILAVVPIILGIFGLTAGLTLVIKNRKFLSTNYHPLVPYLVIILCLLAGITFTVLSFEIITLTSTSIFGGNSPSILEFIELLIDLLL